MPLQIQLQNQQRRQKVDLAWFEETVDLLAAEALRNLKNNRPKHLKARLLAEMPRRGAFSLVIVSNAAIRKLNKQWRGKDYATDVLSFPLELEIPPPGAPWEIGEIVISAEKAHEQAGEYGHSFEREMAFLFVHGFLHVLGFDHETPAEEKEMFGRQKAILKAAGIKR
ncbi:MAG: rRNA maturation RNase YbeY [Candidatus Obscuribacterales bacterium]|nr:rRNA maturation RNase YbeY [Candidatus Obscuribacterales bacterium]